MTAFVAFIRAYGIWLYVLFGFGILFGIKMMVDARRLSRKPLFSLDNERAREAFSRGITLILLMLLFGCALTAFIAIVVPIVPPPEPAIVRGLSPTAPVAFPTLPPLPTGTPPQIKPADATNAASTPAPTTLTTATLSNVGTTPATSVTLAPRPTTRPSSTPTPVFAVPAPILDPKGPVYNNVAVTGENAMNNAIRFQWTWYCDQCVLTSNDKFVVVITYVEKATGGIRTVVGSTQNNYLTLGEILRGYGDIGQFYQKAVDDKYTWLVQVKRNPGDQPISPPSESWKFLWH